MDDGDVRSRVGHLDLDGFSAGLGAADPAAVGDVLVPGSDALDEDDVLSVEGSLVDLLLGHDLSHDLGIVAASHLGGLVHGGSDGEQDSTHGVLGSVVELELEVAHVSGDVLGGGSEVDGDEGVLVDLLDGLCEEVLHSDSVLFEAEVACESSELILPLHEVHRVSLGSDVESGGHSGDSSSDDRSGVGDGDLGSDERLEETGLGDSHPEEVLRLGGGSLVLVHVNPGALVADVCHVVEVLVQSSVPAGLPEQRLVGPRCAGSDDDPVQVVIGDGLGDGLETVLCAGVLGFLGEDDIGQGLGVGRNGGHIDHRANVDSAVADPNSDPGLLSGDVLLGRVDLGGAGGEVLVDNPCTGLGCGSAGLGDGGGDVLGGGEGSGDEDTGLAGLQGVEDGGLTESVLVQLDSEGVGELLSVLGRDETDRQDDHVEVIGYSIALGVGVVDVQLLGLGVLLDVGDTGGPVHVDAVLALSPVDVGLELLSVGPDVHEEDVFLEVSVLLGDHGLLDSVHAAHGRAVLLPSGLLGPGSAALDVGDLLGVLSAGGDDDVSPVGSGGAHEPLVLDCGDDILVSAISVLGCDIRIPDLESGGGDDGSDLDGDELVLVIVVDGALAAVLRAQSALALLNHVAAVALDDGDAGHCLRMGYVDGLPVDETVLVLVGNVLDRTLGDTVAASGTLLGVDVPGLLEDGDLKVSRLSLDLLDLMVGQNIDVGVSSAVRHLRGEDTRGTVIRREGLVQTAHHSTDGGVLVHQVDVNATVCKIQRSLNSCDSSTDNQCRFTQVIASVTNLVFGTCAYTLVHYFNWYYDIFLYLYLFY